MAAANGDAAHDASLSAAAAAPFSYAQAAKGKSTPTSGKPQSMSPSPHDRAESSSGPSPEISSHGLDSVDDERNPLVNGKSHAVNGDSIAAAHSPHTDPKLETTSLDGPTGAEANSSGQSKDPTQPLPHSRSVDLPWRQRPQDADSVNESVSDTASHKDDRKREKPELIAAPVPSVNIWAQRAQDAKTKAIPLPSAAGKSQQSDTQRTTNLSERTLPVHNNPRPIESHGLSPDGSRERRVPNEDRQSRLPSNGPSNGRLRAAVVKDSQSWPTPETAKDDERRKSQGKAEATPLPANTKPHTKSDKWVSMPFTPSVKFETPLPTGARRGGRINARGGREAGGRGGFAPAGARPTNAGPSAPLVDDSSPSDTRVEKPNKANPTGGKARKAPEDAPIGTAKSAGPSPKPFAGDRRISEPGQAKSDLNMGVPGDEVPWPISSKQNPTPASQANVEPGVRRRNSRVVENDSSLQWNADGDGDRKRGNSLNGSAAKSGWVERRPDVGKPPENRAEYGGTFSRGDMRPDRGRGGKHRGGFFGNHGSSGFQSANNGSVSPIYGPKGSPFQPGFPNAFIPGRNVRSNGPRASSYPNEVYFNSNIPHGFPTSPPAVPTSPGYYAFPGMPVMNQPAYDPYLQQFALMNGIANQLNYYFSIDNLLKDMFLREHMDSAGFVPLAFIADFSRMKSLTTDLGLIKLVAEQSPEFDVRVDLHGKEVLRKKEGWEKFVLPMDQRKPAAQHDGPMPMEEHFDYPHVHSPRHPSDNGHSVAPGPMFPPPFSPIATGSPVNGFSRSSSNRYSLSAIDSQLSYHQAPPTPFLSAQARSVEPSQDEPDAFPDEKIDHLTVVVRPKRKNSQQPEMSRSTSHGTLDGELLHAKDEEPAEEAPNGTHKRDRSARIADLKKSLTSPTPSHKSQLSISSNASLFWIKEQGEEPEQLPANSTYEPYGQVCANAFQQRQTAPPGHCPQDMHLLYQFWSHFLLRNFNTRMYTDFKTMAQEDSQQASQVGLEHLIKYYKDSLLGQRVVRRHVVGDFIALVKDENSQSDGSAFKQLRSAWRNGALMLKNRKIISELIEPGLQAELDR